MHRWRVGDLLVVESGMGQGPVAVFLFHVEKGTGREVDTGRLDRVFTGSSAEALCHAVTDSGLVTRLDHAAYLGRELARAEAALRSGGDYEQDEGDA